MRTLLRSRVVVVPVLAVTAAAASLALAALAGCDGDDETMSWQIEFASRSLRDRAAVVEARIVQGGCTSEEVVYASAFDPDEAGTSPPQLDDGKYGFIARALDQDCYWYAQGCTEAELPKGGGQVMVKIAALDRETLDCDGNDCSSAACRGGTGDAGGDAGATGDEDAGAEDAAVDAGNGGGGAGGVGGGTGTAGMTAGVGGGGVVVEPAPEPAAVVISLEVEQGDPVTAPFMVLQDDLASGGAYVSYPVPTDATLEDQRSMKRGTPPADDAEGGIALLEFDVPRTAPYRLWGRVITPSLDDDSFWIRVDDGDWVQWNDISHQDQTWHWDDVRPFEMRADRWLVNLAEGHHVLRVAYRELGPKIDRVVVASDLNWVPTD